ncbi:hypothetical protein DSO57_1002404 [Entomophthora muscae]|uniref:Uncharacterized protein n=1 Tax=Entomophthora muscae TaxID=34485 RepID=A0ACC2SBA5_9FUNG|nr:hypothetical protein DSO57_1002404 [Entomophthora muscae]
MIIYAIKSHPKVLKDQEVWILDATFVGQPKIFNQLQFILAEVEGRAVPLIQCLMIETKKENYVSNLKFIKKEIQEIVLVEQKTEPTPAGRPPNDLIALIRLKNAKLVLFDFEATKSIVFWDVFGCVAQGCYFHFLSLF